MCERNYHSRCVIDRHAELFLDDIQRIFTPAILANLSNVVFCGIDGDSLYARDYMEICEYFLRSNKYLNIILSTNGSCRNSSWWREYAKLLKGRGEVQFSIEGITQEVHDKYRVGTKLSKILDNAHAFAAEGGHAIWVMTIFKHNQHQVEQCRKHANELGLEFWERKTTWFGQYNGAIISIPVFSQSGRLLYYIEPPDDKRFLNSAYDNCKFIERPLEEVQKFSKDESLKWSEELCRLFMEIKKEKVECWAVDDKMIHITADGQVAPCCNLARRLGRNEFDVNLLQFKHFVERLPSGPRTIDARQGLDKILGGEFTLGFNSMLKEELKWDGCLFACHECSRIYRRKKAHTDGLFECGFARFNHPLIGLSVPDPPQSIP